MVFLGLNKQTKKNYKNSQFPFSNPQVAQNTPPANSNLPFLFCVSSQHMVLCSMASILRDGCKQWVKQAAFFTSPFPLLSLGRVTKFERAIKKKCRFELRLMLVCWWELERPLKARLLHYQWEWLNGYSPSELQSNKWHPTSVHCGIFLPQQ